MKNPFKALLDRVRGDRPGENETKPERVNEAIPVKPDAPAPAEASAPAVAETNAAIRGDEAAPAKPAPEPIPAVPEGVIEWAEAKAMTGEVVIPSGMTEIRDRLFSENKNITSVIIPGTVKKIGENAFFKCANLEKVVLGEGIETVERSAFSFTAIRNITFPDSVKEPWGWALRFVSLDAPATNASGNVLVCVTENLAGEEYSVPEGIEVIASRAMSVKPLRRVRLPGSLRRIEEEAFGWSGLREITIPASVEYIGPEAFFSCDSLESVAILNPDAEVSPGAFSACPALKKIEWAGNRTILDECRLRGRSFLDSNGRLPQPNLNHAADLRFALLSKRCGAGDADGMEKLAELFEKWAEKPDASEFYRRAANLWHFRAFAHGQPEAARWIEGWIDEHPGQRLPSMLAEDAAAPTGLKGYLEGSTLNALGFPFFKADRTFQLEALPGKGVVEVSAYESEDGPDEDGFGRETYYDWWYLDENLREIPGVKTFHSWSNLDRRNNPERIQAAIDEAARIVRERGES